MSIYGINFNGLHIPDGVKCRFASRLNGSLNPVSHNHGCRWALQGVCQTMLECEHMTRQADNGRRSFLCIKRTIKGQDWIGFYIGHKH